ncbi:hypothetical protein HDU76_009982 [Blyttiomyces sp. JEL0837]|nr:hypothetical protein HDU76_009982 [Blyttiomyces sp. JEL0837]
MDPEKPASISADMLPNHSQSGENEDDGVPVLKISNPSHEQLSLSSPTSGSNTVSPVLKVQARKQSLSARSENLLAGAMATFARGTSSRSRSFSGLTGTDQEIENKESRDILASTIPASTVAVSGTGSKRDSTGSGKRRVSLSYITSKPQGVESDVQSAHKPEETMKQLRWLRALSKRHDRITDRLENFIRVRVNVDRPTVSFSVVIDRRNKIDSLTHLIEAEYAFKYLLPPKIEGQTEYEKNVNIPPLECGLLLDSAMKSLRFQDIIGDVLDIDSEVNAVNVFENIVNSPTDEPVIQAISHAMLAEEMPDDDDEDSEVELVNPLINAFKRNSLMTSGSITTSPSHPSDIHRRGTAGSAFSIAVAEERSIDLQSDASLALSSDAGSGGGVGSTGGGRLTQNNENASMMVLRGDGDAQSTSDSFGRAETETSVAPVPLPSTDSVNMISERVAPAPGPSPLVARALSLKRINGHHSHASLNSSNSNYGAGSGTNSNANFGRSGVSVLRRSLTMKNATLDDRLQVTLRNLMALQYFQEFCVEEFTVENLLFWLDVEIFQSCPPGDVQVAYGTYIYKTYLDIRAPLKVNISEEVLADIVCPKNGAIVDQLAFDEAQQNIYSVLKGHSFIRFEKSQKAAEFLKKRSHFENEYKDAKIEGSYFEVFPPERDLIKEITKEIETIPESRLDRDKILNRILHNFFPKSRYFPIEGYFNDPSRVSSTQKHRRRRKEKKISKFFGERPSFEQLQRQLVTANFPNQTAALMWTPGSTRPFYAPNEMDETDASQTGPNSGDVYNKKKKVDKLTEFFGENLTKLELKKQQLADDMGYDNVFSDEDLAEEGYDSLPITTRNDLDPEEKRRLKKQSKKISSILGDPTAQDYAMKILTEKLAEMRRREKMAMVGGSGDVSASVDMTPAQLAALDEDILSSPEETDVATEKPDLDSLKNIRGDLFTRSASSDMSAQLKDAGDIRETKEYKRKKLSKLSSFLGEAAGVVEAAEAEASKRADELGPARSPMTEEERRDQRRRANKLERVLGQVVTPEMFIGGSVVGPDGYVASPVVRRGSQGKRPGGGRMSWVQGLGNDSGASPKTGMRVSQSAASNLSAIASGGYSSSSPPAPRIILNDDPTSGPSSRRQSAAQAGPLMPSSKSPSQSPRASYSARTQPSSLSAQPSATDMIPHVDRSFTSVPEERVPEPEEGLPHVQRSFGSNPEEITVGSPAVKGASGENGRLSTTSSNEEPDTNSSRLSASRPRRRISQASVRHHENLHRISVLLSETHVDKVLDLMDRMIQYDLDQDDAMQEANLAKTLRRKKLAKLNRFFGSKLNPVQLFEQNIFSDLEKMIEEEISDPEELELLRDDLKKVRTQLMMRSDDLRKGLEERALRDLQETSKQVSKENRTTHLKTYEAILQLLPSIDIQSQPQQSTSASSSYQQPLANISPPRRPSIPTTSILSQPQQTQSRPPPPPSTTTLSSTPSQTVLLQQQLAAAAVAAASFKSSNPALATSESVQPPPIVPSPAARKSQVGGTGVFRVGIKEYRTGVEGDLAFDVGDVIEVVADVDENWMSGLLNGQMGIFPKSFTEPKPPKPSRPVVVTPTPPPLTSRPTITAPKPTNTATPPTTPGGGPAPPPLATKPAVPPPTTAAVSSSSSSLQQPPPPTLPDQFYIRSKANGNVLAVESGVMATHDTPVMVFPLASHEGVPLILKMEWYHYVNGFWWGYLVTPSNLAIDIRTGEVKNGGTVVLGKRVVVGSSSSSLDLNSSSNSHLSVGPQRWRFRDDGFVVAEKMAQGGPYANIEFALVEDYGRGCVWDSGVGLEDQEWEVVALTAGHGKGR